MKTITETTQQNNSITLKKDSKGQYNWEIKCYGDDFNKITEKLAIANDQMKKIWGENNARN